MRLSTSPKCLTQCKKRILTVSAVSIADALLVDGRVNVRTTFKDRVAELDAKFSACSIPGRVGQFAKEALELLARLARGRTWSCYREPTS